MLPVDVLVQLGVPGAGILAVLLLLLREFRAGQREGTIIDRLLAVQQAQDAKIDSLEARDIDRLKRIDDLEQRLDTQEAETREHAARARDALGYVERLIDWIINAGHDLVAAIVHRAGDPPAAPDHIRDSLRHRSNWPPARE